MEDVITAEQQFFREQEEALMRENEEAQRLEDEANETKHLEEAAQTAQKDIMNASQEVSALRQNEEQALSDHNAIVTNEQSKAQN